MNQNFLSTAGNRLHQLHLQASRTSILQCPTTTVSMTASDATDQQVQLDNCINNMKHLSHDERLEVLGQMKGEIAVVEHTAIEKATEQILESMEHLSKTCRRLEAAGVAMPNLQPFFCAMEITTKSGFPTTTIPRTTEMEAYDYMDAYLKCAHIYFVNGNCRNLGEKDDGSLRYWMHGVYALEIVQSGEYDPNSLEFKSQDVKKIRYWKRNGRVRGGVTLYFQDHGLNDVDLTFEDEAVMYESIEKLKLETKLDPEIIVC